MRDVFHVTEPFCIGTSTTAATYTTPYHATPVALGSGQTDGALGTGTVLYKKICLMKQKILGVALVMTEASVSTAAIVIGIAVRPTIGSNTNARTVDTLSISSDSLGDQWQNIAPGANTDVEAGEEIVLWISTKGTASTGTCYIGVITEPTFYGKVGAAGEVAKQEANAIGTYNSVIA